ncbi:MAG: ATP synthase F1 subunit delta [bacterium]
MKENVLAKRYARALFEIAKERGLLDKIYHEIDFLNKNLQSNEELQLFFSSQEMSKKEKKTTLDKMLQDRVSNVFFNFLSLLLMKNRESLFSTIAKQFGIMFDDHNKKIRAKATTAVPLDSKSFSNLKSHLDNAYSADVQISNQVDPSILGGIIVNIQGQVFDGCLQSQLHRLKSKLIAKSNSNLH